MGNPTPYTIDPGVGVVLALSAGAILLLEGYVVGQWLRRRCRKKIVETNTTSSGTAGKEGTSNYYANFVFFVYSLVFASTILTIKFFCDFLRFHQPLFLVVISSLALVVLHGFLTGVRLLLPPANNETNHGSLRHQTVGTIDTSSTGIAATKNMDTNDRTDNVLLDSTISTKTSSSPSGLVGWARFSVVVLLSTISQTALICGVCLLPTVVFCVVVLALAGIYCSYLVVREGLDFGGGAQTILMNEKVDWKIRGVWQGSVFLGVGVFFGKIFLGIGGREGFFL